MGDSVIWFLLSCKRQVKRVSFLVVLLCIPLLLFAAAALSRKEDGGLRIALYGEEGLGREAAEALIRLPGACSFYLCESEEEVKQDVAAGRAECGYLFPDDLRERLEQDGFRRSIQLYFSPASVLSSMSEEVVFSVIMEIYGPELLERYSREQGWDQAAVEALYQKYSADGSTFSFRYEEDGKGTWEENRLAVIFPVRGIGAVFVFMTGIFAAAALAEDEKKGLFLRVSGARKHWYFFLGILAAVFLGAAAVLISLFLTGEAAGGASGFWKEIAAMAVYGTGVALFSCLLKQAARRGEVIVSLTPFFLIGSLALCPVFIDAGRWIPGLRTAGRLFLPWYYLRLFR